MIPEVRRQEQKNYYEFWTSLGCVASSGQAELQKKTMSWEEGRKNLELMELTFSVIWGMEKKMQIIM